MAYFFVNPLNIDEIVDPKTGELTTLRLVCQELQPRTFNVNLLRQPAHVRNQLAAYVKAKQRLMLPIREGKTQDGVAFFVLEQGGQIIPISSDFVPPSAVDASAVDLPADTSEKPKFGDLSKRAAT